MKRTLSFAVAVAGLSLSPAWAQDHGPVQVTPAVRHDTLESLRNTKPQADGYKLWHDRDEHMLPIPPVPADQMDAAVQNSAVPRSAVAPTLQSSVDGIGEGFVGTGGSFSVQWAPPDTVGAVGATQYMQVVNTGLAVFDKATKNAVYGPVPTNTLWAGFGGECESHNDGDAIVVYDKDANRWVVSQFAVLDKTSTEMFQCVAVSQTADATGGWYRYAFSYGTDFPDYPKMGVWADAYYETFNMFSGKSGPFFGSKLCAYDRKAMLAGAAATQQCFQLSSTYGGVLPSDLDGPTAPPASSPNYLVNYGTNSLNLWKFHVDWANAANTTLTGPTVIPVAAFTPACNGGSCIPQPGTHQQLDSLADRVMFRLAYRNFGDHESLVVNHAVRVGTTKNPYSGVRWYEIRSPGAATPVVFQQSTFSPDQSYRWMGSVAMDGQGNMALGYSVSSATLAPAIRYTSRLSGDAVSTMQAETSIMEGPGVQSGSNLDRWGDYSAMTVDPVDDCTFWYTNEYLQATGAFNWNTRITSLSFPGCSAGKQSQTINFTSSAPAASYLGAPYTVMASATSGLPVKFVIAAASSSVCALSGGGSGSQVTFTGVGTCTIEASQGGSATYNAAPLVQQTFAVGKGAQTINFTSSAPAATYNGSAYTVTATATSGLAVTLAIDPLAAGICQLDGSASGSHVSFTGVGTCIIDATQDGNANYNAASPSPVQQSFAVGKGAQMISFGSTAPSGAVFGGATYAVTASATSALPVSLSIESGTVCQLDGSASGAHVSFIGVGTCVIDADQSGNGNYNAAPQNQQSFAVGQATQAITFDSSAPGNASAGGATYQVLASASSGLAVTLAVDAAATSVCELDGSASGAHVSFIGAGNCTIDATQSGDTNHSAAAPKQQSFAVSPGAPTQLVFTQQPAAVTAGDTLATIAVTEKDTFGDVVDDNASLVTFTVPACGGNAVIGSATMVHGVATLTSVQRFYTATDPATLQVAAQTGALSGSSNGFVVQANLGLTFADGFEGCRL